MSDAASGSRTSLYQADGGAGASGVSGLADSMDTVEMWVALHTSIEELADLVVRFVQFWERCSEFLDGRRQQSLPNGYKGESQVHLEFSDIQVREIRQYGHQVVNSVISDLTDYFSARPQRPTSVASGLPIASMFSKEQAGEDSYLFLPPHANALGTVKYTTRVFGLLASSFANLASAFDEKPVQGDVEKALYEIRSKFADAAMHAWMADSRKFGQLEDWAIDVRNPSCTGFPHFFHLYHEAVITGLHDLLSVGTSESKSGETISTESRKTGPVLGRPSQTVVRQVLQACSQSLGSCITSAVNQIITDNTQPNLDYGVSSAAAVAHEELAPLELKPDAKVLLTLSNILSIQNSTLKPLLSHLEQVFGVSTRDINLHLTNVFEELESKLFAFYTQSKRASLSDIVRDGFETSRDSWRATSAPESISPYVYECLLNMVGVHAKVLDVSRSSVKRVIVVLYEHLLKMILANLREVETFGSGGSLQAFADVEFLDSIMMNFKTAEAQNTVQNIHVTLKNATLDPKLWQNKDGPRQYVKDVVRTALRKSRLNFLCFTEWQKR
jgi:exocyst complex component 2